MADIPLPDPRSGWVCDDHHMTWYGADQMRAHAAAVSAAENSELRADNIRLQNEVVGPLRERVKEVEVESLAFVYERNEAQERVHALTGRVKILEDALERTTVALDRAFSRMPLLDMTETLAEARAALGGKP